ncbi:MAG: glycosyltransferase [Gammaproteobacteria bacterium]|nr:glycosyltransferase [Gammaproteobacteria bacterium]
MNTFESNLSVIILTRDEEFNIGKCIQSILPLTDKIYIVDSGSIDRTVEVATGMGAHVVQRDWTNYADQMNWGLGHFDFSTDWIMRMDADETLTPELVRSLADFLASPDPKVSGVYVRRRVYFMGRWIRHGGYYPTWLLRVFRKGIGSCEAQWMDEHIVVSEGNTVFLKADIIDDNRKDLTFWTDKHNRYASREVLDILNKARQSGDDSDTNLHGQARLRRLIKDRVYGRMPLFVRPFLYFLYRYFIRLGFLDGREGLIFHFLQGFWYRFLVDAKVYEHRRQQAVEKGRAQ